MLSALEPYGISTGYRMIIAGGGTGGHLFPGIAIAQAFVAKHLRNQVLFINAGRPMDTEVLTRLKWPYMTIPIQGIKQHGRLHQISAVLKIPRALVSSSRIIRQFNPDVVLGVGGYSAGPVVMAAWMMRICTALHEQNQLPGLTNRLLRRMVKRIYLTFEDESHYFAPDKCVVSGNPVRDEIIALGGHDKRLQSMDTFTLLILGGSQGAHAINQAMVEALPFLRKEKETQGLKIIHQTGRQDENLLSQAYASAGVTADVKTFFTRVAEQYHQADLIICRAGATTVAEITAVGRAAIFIPFPHAADDHQTNNAKALVTAGAAEMIQQKELSGKVLAQKIITHIRNRGNLSQMADRALTLGRPDAALTIVNDIYKLIEG